MKLSTFSPILQKVHLGWWGSMRAECDFLLRRDVVIGARVYFIICAGCKFKAGTWWAILLAFLRSASLHRTRHLISLQFSRRIVLCLSQSVIVSSTNWKADGWVGNWMNDPSLTLLNLKCNCSTTSAQGITALPIFWNPIQGCDLSCAEFWKVVVAHPCE